MSKTVTPTKSPTSSPAVDELKELVRDAEKVLSASGDEANEKIAELRDRMRQVLEESRGRLEHVKQAACEHLHQCDDYVRTHPYHALGVAAGIGALVGLLVSARRSA